MIMSKKPLILNKSEITIFALRDVLARFSFSFAARTLDISTAVTLAPAADNCIVLPPGAAHKSRADFPFTSLKRCTGILAEIS